MKQLLGDFAITVRYFDGLEKVIRSLKKLKGVDRKKSESVNRALLELIQKESEPCFLLPAVLQFVARVDEEKILKHYVFTSFELWLNQLSGLSAEENYRVRGKIVGKFVARSEYQNLFPIGMGKMYEGTHFVTAHKSPDLDTTIASFWGWLDAFAARVSSGLHIWNLPGGPPGAQIEIEWIFKGLFGAAVFSHLPKTRLMLGLTGNDLMVRKGMQCKTGQDSIANIDHDRDSNAVVIVNEEGFYLGDWRATDVEGVRQVIILLSACLRWFENALQLQLITLFAKKALKKSDFSPVLNELLSTKVLECEPAEELSLRQKKQVDDFITKVLGLVSGGMSTLEELAIRLCELSNVPFGGSKPLIHKMEKSGLFAKDGSLKEDLPQIFTFLEKTIQSLHLAIVGIRARLEKIDIALQTKFSVFGRSPTVVTTRSDVEEIQSKMTNYAHLTVVYPDDAGLFPVGVIQASDLRKSCLGTVSLRDFCNRDEMGIPPYLEVISVIDHHKSALNTFAPPLAIIADVQSSNTLVAQKAFEINDLYAKGSKKRSLKQGYFVHPMREYVEYLHFLYGIIDDTDLLSKVSAPDVECVASILNRLKSISTGRKETLMNLDDLERDERFAKIAAKRILQNEDMYSLYSKVYKHREKEITRNISLASAGEPSNFFADTKEQNGCCRVGQTKVFAGNIASYERFAQDIRSIWLQKAIQTQKEKPEIDLHIHMISTIVDAEEVYQGISPKHNHQDELWLWAASNEVGQEHLRRFLGALSRSPGVVGQEFSVEFTGANRESLSQTFAECFEMAGQTQSNKELPIAIMRYKPGLFNSRKAMISPYLPTLRK